jgi:hypothetical protein
MKIRLLRDLKPWHDSRLKWMFKDLLEKSKVVFEMARNKQTLASYSAMQNITLVETRVADLTQFDQRGERYVQDMSWQKFKEVPALNFYGQVKSNQEPMIPHGWGVKLCSLGDSVWLEIGNYVEGRLHGFGRRVFADNAQEGPFKHGIRHGKIRKTT